MRAFASLATAILIVAWSVPALGQSVSEMAGKKFADSNSVADQEIVNASRALEEAIKTYATSGESTRGATGPLSSLLIESDTIICASWLIAFDRTMTTLAVQGAFNTAAGAELMRAMQNLKNRVEAACQRVLNNTEPPGVHGPTGEGNTPPSPCPECEDEKQAYENAQYAFDRAEFELQRATLRAQFVFEMWSAGHRSLGMGIVSTPEEAERDVTAKEKAAATAQKIRDTVHRLYLECLEACHKAARDQFGFFDSTRNKVLVATAAVLVATATISGGGGGTPAAFVSTPTPAPVAQAPTVTPVVNTPPSPAPPAPTPATLLSLIVGQWACAACQPINDADRHELTLRFCAQLVALFQLTANSPMRIDHPAPWVTVSGELDETTGAYRATGTSRVATFANVSSTVTGTFQRSGDTVSAVDLTVTLGENGAFPGGRPVTYAVRLAKRP